LADAAVDKGLGTCTSTARSDAMGRCRGHEACRDQPPRERL